MKILTVDVGTGTQDLMLYDTEKDIENSLVMIMPSPTTIVADRIKKATERRKNILLRGDVMGGGPSVRAIKDHIDRGYYVYATEKAALTINDNIEKIRSMGIKIVEEDTDPLNYGDPVEIYLQDIEMEAIENALGSFGVDMPDRISFAVQDHGNSPDISNRIYRFSIFKQLIDNGGDLAQFAYRINDIPPEFTRMTSAAKNIAKKRAMKEIIVMDTGPAAIFGALLDTNAVQPAIVVNVGNGHTLIALVDDNRMVALLEHHTSALEGMAIQKHIINMAHGTTSFDDIFNEGGHGCHIRYTPGIEAIMSVMITGPRRNLLSELSDKEKDSDLWKKLYFAAPFGNMMLSGCYGLLTPYIKKCEDETLKR